MAASPKASRESEVEALHGVLGNAIETELACHLARETALVNYHYKDTENTKMLSVITKKTW